MNKCPFCKLEKPADSELCVCGYNFTTCMRDVTETPLSASRSSGEGVRLMGISLIFLGLVLSAYFAMLYDASVASDGDRYYNMGLLQNRQSGILGGIGLSILGGIILLYGKES